MPFEKSCGAVIFRQEGKKTYFLLLEHSRREDRTKHYFDLPKGHVEKGEEELDTVKREVEEETGITDLNFNESFRERIHYFFKVKGETISKDVIFFLAETKTEKVKISHEHTGYRWAEPEEAIKTATYKTAKDVLTKAKKFLDSGLRKFL